MIKYLEIDGFKSIRHFCFHFDGLNVLTGLNSSGKSTVIQSICILSNIANRRIDIIPNGMGGEAALRNSECAEMNITATIQKDGNTVLCSYKNKQSVNYKFFPKVIYVSAERSGAKNSIITKENHEIGSNGDNVIKCIEYYNEHHQLPASICPNIEDSSTSFRMVVEKWLQAITPNMTFDYQFITDADSSYSTYNGYRASNVGFGLSYTLTVIVAILIGVVEKDSVVLIENPEAHLHPKGQAMMADLVCKAVSNGAQIIIETHSDHFFDGIRIFSKENNGFNKKVKPFWFKLVRERDIFHTEVESLELSNSGRLNRWPEDMFTQFLINATRLI